MAANETTPISFQEMDLSEEILKAVADMGFTEPSTIQQKTIPLMMSGADINAKNASNDRRGPIDDPRLLMAQTFIRQGVECPVISCGCAPSAHRC